MNYEQDILNKFLDQLESRKTSEKPLSFSVEKKYPDYREPFSEIQQPINEAVDRLIGWGLITGKKDVQGYYTKLFMALDCCEEAYRIAGRISPQSILKEQTAIVMQAQKREGRLLGEVCKDFLCSLSAGRFPKYGIERDCEKLRDVLTALEKLPQLQKETYIRNFSEAVFHSSKRFQAIQTSVVHILMDYTPNAADEDTILQQYELYPNPAYVYFKGGWKLHVGDAVFQVLALPGGMGLPVTALASITQIELLADRVISVENLTTYHDTPETDGAVLYLGGFPNQVRVEFLKRLYQDAPGARYFHRGDLDPYGFLILENLREKTQIPFKALQMDLETLEHCFETGHYRKLEKTDLKAMKYPMLEKYEGVFAYMRKHNCKIEQECFEAMKLKL